MEKEQEKKDEEKNSNLPKIVSDNPLSKIINENKYKIADGGRRGLKILGATSLFVLGVGSAAIAPGIVGTSLLLGGIYAGVRAGANVIYKTEPSLMFVSKRGQDGERQIFQDTRIGLDSHMKDFDVYEKSSMMALQALIGFERYKQSLKGTPYTEKENGVKVYDQKYSTVTHKANFRNFDALIDLGLIESDKVADRQPVPKYRGFIGSVRKAVSNIGKSKDDLENSQENIPTKKTYLIFEKLGFGRFDELKKMGKAFISGDKKTLRSYETELKKVNFRLTDKPIDFEDIYLKINGARPYESQEEKRGLNRFKYIFLEEPVTRGDKVVINQGILVSKKIDIGKDSTGRPILIYGKRSFSERMRPILEQELEKKSIETGENSIEKNSVEQEKNKDKIAQKTDEFLENTGSKVDASVIDSINQVGASFKAQDNPEEKSIDDKEK